jgi:hypothetical protein
MPNTNYLTPMLRPGTTSSVENAVNTKVRKQLNEIFRCAIQKGPFYFGIKVFNHLPTSIKKTSHDINQFRSVLKSFLIINLFYSLVEYFIWNSNSDLGLV